jgi:6-phospho-beta-glucosidase
MKIAVIGGGGVRTPLLVNGLTHSDLPIDEIALFDIDRDRLAVIAPLAAMYSATVRAYDEARGAVSGASFVFLSIRVGGIAARARDEAIAIAHGVVGQETVGPAGFAMAMRTIPRALEYMELIETEAPAAWVINFTNPVSIITQALTATTVRAIGICDTPTELFEDVARTLDLESSRCDFDYFGLNHLGWLREVYCDGVPQLARLWDDSRSLERVYRSPIFEAPFLRGLSLLPTEYLFYYYRPLAALENLRRAGRTRGDTIAALNDRLFRDLRAAGADRRRDIYERYLDARSASYMQIEAGGSQPIARSPATLTGYDKIALDVVRAIHGDSNAIIPLNVRNRGALRDLDDADVVEVPCVVNANGARPLAVGVLPEGVDDLVMRVKDYEWLTLEAASTGVDEDAERALARHPLVDDTALAKRLVAALKPWA